MRLILVAAALLGVAFAARVSYDGYKVLRFNPSENQLQLLKNFKNRPGFDFWKEPRKHGDSLDIMVSPGQQSPFLTFLSDNKIGFTVLNENVNINSYLEELAVQYPDLVTLQSIGLSYEGREMVVIKISTGGDGQRPAVLVDGGIHAREWIAPAMALYIINQLVENNTANSDLTDAVDWYILPVLNPDGYEYSRDSERLWRKSRSVTSTSSECRGVDQNRNYDFHWMENGASSYPCAETYAGEEAFSEPENRNLRDFADAYKDQIKLYITFHSYGQYLLYPWGYTSDLPSDWETLQELAERVNAAQVAAGGDSFEIGTSTNVLYAAAGGSDDYMKGVVGIDLSYTVELTDTPYGFQLPAELIEPTVTQFFEGVRVFGTYVKENF